VCSRQNMEKKRARQGTVMARAVRHKDNKRHLEKCFRIAGSKGLVKVSSLDWLARISLSVCVRPCVCEQAMAHLEGLGVVPKSADAIGEFLHKHLAKFDAELVGEYLGGKRYGQRARSSPDCGGAGRARRSPSRRRCASRTFGACSCRTWRSSTA